MELGVLSSKHESEGNPGAIGYDGPGGWSYGSYQIASNPQIGTFATFMKFCHDQFPQTAQVLEAAGGLVAAIAGTNVFKIAWRQLAIEQREAFIHIQHQFIVVTHYGVAIQALVHAGYDLRQRSHTIAEVIFSLAVAAGPGSTKPNKNGLKPGCAGLVCDAIQATGHPLLQIDDHGLIEAIYSQKLKRIDTGKEYATQTVRIKASVRKRFATEKLEALTMLAAELTLPNAY